MKKTLRLLKKIFLYSFVGLLVIIIATLLIFWIEHSTSLTLPNPSGTYAVGRTTFDWVDNSRVDSLAPTLGVKRELAVWVWYPADKKEPAKTNEYLPPYLKKAIEENDGFIMTNFFTRDLSKIYSHSIANVGISTKQTKYPIVFLKSGLGALATDYTTLAEDLASHGYVVVGCDAPYSTFIVAFPDGRVIKRTEKGNPGGENTTESTYQTQLMNNLVNVWTDDTKFILNKLDLLNVNDSSNLFFGHIDTQSVGIFGHSFGGATAAQFCSAEPRCKAGIDIDGEPYGSVIQTGINKPFMFLISDHSNEDKTEDDKITSHIESIYNSLPKGSVWINLVGAKHFNFSDMSLAKERLLFRLAGATGSIDKRRGLKITADCVRTFFDLHLKGNTTTEIDSLQSKYPEVNFYKKK